MCALWLHQLLRDQFHRPLLLPHRHAVNVTAWVAALSALHSLQARSLTPLSHLLCPPFAPPPSLALALARSRSTTHRMNPRRSPAPREKQHAARRRRRRRRRRAPEEEPADQTTDPQRIFVYFHTCALWLHQLLRDQFPPSLLLPHRHAVNVTAWVAALSALFRLQARSLTPLSHLLCPPLAPALSRFGSCALSLDHS